MKKTLLIATLFFTCIYASAQTYKYNHSNRDKIEIDGNIATLTEGYKVTTFKKVRTVGRVVTYKSYKGEVLKVELSYSRQSLKINGKTYKDL